MIGFGRSQHAQNHFTVRSYVEVPRPEPVAMESNDYSEDEEEVIVRPKKSKKHRLPGAKLLKRLARDRAKEKAEWRAKKDSRHRNNYSESAEADEMAEKLRKMFRGGTDS